MAASDIAVGWTTVASAEEAEALSKRLLEENLAACVQVDPEVKSFYPWKGEFCSEVEVRIWVKTTVEAARVLETTLVEIHPYETPQWVWVSASGASKGYSDWVFAEVAKHGKS